MPRFPIVIQGDWMQLTYEDAPDRETALLQAAQRYIEAVDEQQLRLGPITGHCTPTVELTIYNEDNEEESTWTVPDES